MTPYSQAGANTFYGADNAIFIGMCGTSANCQMNVEIVRHWEVIPLRTVAPFFDARLCFGSEEEIDYANKELSHLPVARPSGTLKLARLVQNCPPPPTLFGSSTPSFSDTLRHLCRVFAGTESKLTAVIRDLITPVEEETKDSTCSGCWKFRDEKFGYICEEGCLRQCKPELSIPDPW